MLGAQQGTGNPRVTEDLPGSHARANLGVNELIYDRVDFGVREFIIDWEFSPSQYYSTWIFESELVVELHRRRSRQACLRRVHQRFRLYIRPELVHSASVYMMRRFIVSRDSASSPRDSQLACSHGSIPQTDDVVGLVQSHEYYGKLSHKSSRGVDLGGGGGRGVRPYQRASQGLADNCETAAVETPAPDLFVVVREGVPFAFGPQGFMVLEHGSAMYVTVMGSAYGPVLSQYGRGVSSELGVVVAETQPIVSREGEGILVDAEGLMCTSFIREGFVIPGYVNYGGVYKHGGDAILPMWGRKARFPFERLSGGEENWVYTPGLRQLFKKFGACDDSEGVMRSAMNELEVRYPSLPTEMKRAMIMVLRSRAQDHSALLKSGKLRATPPTILSQAYVEGLRQSGVCVKYGLYKLEYSECPLRPETDPLYRRDLFDVRSIVGGSFEDGQLVWDVQEASVKDVLVGCTFQGLKGFTYYRESPNNQAAAMVRLFKCRGGTRDEDRVFSALQNTFIFDRYQPNLDWFSQLGRFTIEYTHDGVSPANLGVRQFERISMHMVDQTCGMTHGRRVFERCDDERHPAIAEWFVPLFAEYCKASSFLVYLMWCFWIFAGQVASVVSRCTGYVSGFVLTGLEMSMLAFVSLVDLVLFRVLHSALNHAKRRIRQAIGRLRYGQLRPVARGFMRSFMSAAVKDEAAKPGKPPRMYFNLGLMSSMLGAPWVDLAKKKLWGERVVFFAGFKLRVQFVGENSYTAVSELFNTLWESHTSGLREVFATVMSDDVGVSTPDGFYLLDISMCDASLGPAIFWLVVVFLRAAWVPELVIKGMMDQVSRAVQVVNPCAKLCVLVFQFLTYYLVSGTVLTTLTDTIASLMVVSAFMAGYAVGLREPSQFYGYFRAVGLVVTAERYSDFHHFCMLKRRPVRLVGQDRWGAPLAIGCLLKRFGCIDVKGKGLAQLVPKSCETLESQVRAFLGAVVESWKSEPSHLLLDVFRERFPHVGARLRSEDDEWVDERFADVQCCDRVSVDSLLECYGASRAEYDEAVVHANELVVGSLSFTSFMSKVMEKDYGL